MGTEGIAPSFLNLGSIWGWMVSSTRRLLYGRGKSPGTQCTGCLVDPRASLDIRLCFLIRNNHTKNVNVT